LAAVDAVSVGIDDAELAFGEIFGTGEGSDIDSETQEVVAISATSVP
jgi:hypothetical protein